VETLFSAANMLAMAGWLALLQHYPLTLNQCDRISSCRFNGF